MEKLEFELSMKWLKFYTYFLLPLRVLSILAEMDNIEKTSILPLWLTIYIYGEITLIVAVCIGLFMQRLWGWYLNWVFLLILCIDNFLLQTGIENKIGLIIGGIVFTAANVVYFRKREKYFYNYLISERKGTFSILLCLGAVMLRRKRKVLSP